MIMYDGDFEDGQTIMYDDFEDRSVCLCVELTNKDAQDEYVLEYLLAFLKDECINAEVYDALDPGERHRT